MSVAAYFYLVVDVVALGLITTGLIARRRLKRASKMMVVNPFYVPPHQRPPEQMMQFVAVGGGGGFAAGNGGAGIAQEAPLVRRHAWTPGTLQQAQIPGGIEYRDAEGRFHREDGPALEFKPCSTLPFGAKYWYWHGLECNERVVMRPQDISIHEIEAALCMSVIYTECVRVMVERYVGHDANDGLRGEHRFIRDCLAQGFCWRIDRDERFGTLVSKSMGLYGGVIVMAIVTNRTPEDDGSFKTHYLRVPPDMKTAREAVAWTFGLSSRQYDPIKES